MTNQADTVTDRS